MEELKFRAWDGEKIFKIGRIDFYDNSLGIFEENDGLYKPNTIIMQYTGLQDKNGKEIYEGDIVKCDIWGDGKIQTFKMQNFSKDTLHWYGHFQSIVDDNLYIEVIGNIYENPNLLDNN